MQVRVLFPEHEKKLIGEERGGAEHDHAEARDAADDGAVLKAHFARGLAAGEGGDEDVGE